MKRNWASGSSFNPGLWPTEWFNSSVDDVDTWLLSRWDGHIGTWGGRRLWSCRATPSNILDADQPIDSIVGEMLMQVDEVQVNRSYRPPARNILDTDKFEKFDGG